MQGDDAEDAHGERLRKRAVEDEQTPQAVMAYGDGSSSDLPIGVFDSGVGGLTVLRELLRHLPQEQFVYLGDTARLPYGTKSAESVVRYSLQATGALIARGVKYLVVACNTASSVALPFLSERYAPLRVIGVIQPGAAAASTASRSGAIAVLATEGTVRGGAYQRSLTQLRSDARVYAQPCSLFVALAEEGWTDGPIVEAVARRYVSPLLERHPDIDTLLLGCTHFPVIAATLQQVVGTTVAIVDSARTTAEFLRADLERLGLTRRSEGRVQKVQLLATDGVERFAAVGSRFLGYSVQPHEVELVDLGATAMG